jgi:hypothetical protein
MKRLNNFLNEMRTPRKIVVSRGALLGITLGIIACLATPLWAVPFFFPAGSPNGQRGALSRLDSPGKIETKAADDVLLRESSVIKGATIAGLLPAGTPLDNIVEVEIYRIFPLDSASPSGKTVRANSLRASKSVPRRVPDLQEHSRFPRGF